jgi:hypothetical protein
MCLRGNLRVCPLLFLPIVPRRLRRTCPRPQAAVRTRRLAAGGPHRVARTAEPRLPRLPWCAVQRAGEGAGAGRRRRKTRARYARRPQLRSSLRTLLFAHAWTQDSRCSARASEEAATMVRARPAESTGARCARANMNMRGNLRVPPLLFFRRASGSSSRRTGSGWWRRCPVVLWRDGQTEGRYGNRW